MNQDSLLAEMERRLITLIPKQVQSLRIREAMYCLRIWYFGSDSALDDWQFKLTLKPAALRARLVAEKGAESPHYIWCADECEDGSGVINSVVVDPPITKYYRAWSEAAFGGDGLPDDSGLVPLQRMTQRVAQKLNQIDWQPFCSVTDDFVVFPADGSHSIMNDFGELTASVSPETIKQLRTRRYLGSKEWYRL